MAKTKQIVKEKEEISKIEQLKTFFIEAKEELKKVVWPDKKTVINATWVVLAITIIIAGVLGIIDIIFSNLIKFIFS